VLKAAFFGPVSIARRSMKCFTEFQEHPYFQHSSMLPESRIICF
jgi:hypothetical protein